MTRRARLTVLGGFLGAGKSTWLRHHLLAGVFVGACVIVNEAAATPVDDLLLSGAPRLLVLAGGCACCERKADLLALLGELCASAQPPERIVLETSGLADPRPIVDAIRGDPSLAAHLEVGEVVVLVDAARGLDLLRREPLARRQVAAADCLIVTKPDEADDTAVAELVAALGLMRPGTPLFGATSGVETALPAEADDVLAIPALAVPGDDVGLPICAARVDLGDAGWAVFSLWLSALLHARGPDILRVKGVVGTPAGRLLVQAVQTAVQRPAILPGPAAADDGTMVVIGRGFAAGDAQRAFDAFAAACQS